MLPFKSKSFAFLIGFVAFILVFFINWTVNLFVTSILRGAIAFIVFYILAILIHFLIKQLNANEIKNSNSKINLETDEELDFNEIYQTSDTANESLTTNFEPIEFIRMQLKE